MELIRPIKQKIWGWPAVFNFVMLGTATGFYLLNFLIAILKEGSLGVSEPIGFQILSPVLVCIGFSALTLESGKPDGAHHLFRHIPGSWMSIKILTASIFVPAAIMDWFFPNPIVRGLAVTAAMGLMFSQGFIVYRAKAVTAWNVWLMPLLFLTSDFAKGSGLILLLTTEKLPLAATPIKIALICALLNLLAWLLYLYRSNDPAFLEATKPMRRSSSLFGTFVIGHLLPILLLLSFLLGVGGNDGAAFQHIALDLSGLILIASGVSLMFSLIVRIGYDRGIRLERDL
jgi:phenylacetyl-CoA:acceptor oxidoreductase 26-kDa subunit